MKTALVILLLLHGCVHLLGVAKAFELAPLPALKRSISRPLGVLWALAASGLWCAALLLLEAPSWWWVAGLAGVVLSQAAIATAWRDARLGTLANVLLLAGVAWGYASEGPSSFQARYEREVAQGLAAMPPDARLVTEADLLPLPLPVQRYLRTAGVVGKPRVHAFQLRFTGRLRGSPEARWMPFVAEQTSFLDSPARFFLMKATLFGVPVQAFHEYAAGAATMKVKLLSAFSMADAAGPEMNRAETVTVFNDLCLLAPAALIDPAIAWQALDARHAQATWSNAGNTISAVLTIDDVGALVDFESDDRRMSSPDLKTFTPVRWATPITSFGTFAGVRMMRHGAAVWKLPDGDFTYGEFELEALTYSPVR